MVRGWKLKLIRPEEAIRVSLFKAWALALKDLEQWVSNDLVNAMVHGGLGLVGIEQTTFYQFVSSEEGLSQLGIESSEPPKLLDAYKKTIKVSSNKTLLQIKFGDMALLKMATPHPASGTGNLHIESWMEWIVDGVKVNSGFVPRSKLPSAIRKNIRVRSSPGGLMLPKGSFGSQGLWRVPQIVSNFEKKWLNDNVAKIEKHLHTQMVSFLNKRLK